MAVLVVWVVMGVVATSGASPGVRPMTPPLPQAGTASMLPMETSPTDVGRWGAMAVAAPTAVVTFVVSPGTCNLEFNGTVYSNGSSADFNGDGESYILLAPSCPETTFIVWGESANLDVRSNLSASTSVAVWGNGTLWLNDTSGPVFTLGIDVLPPQAGAVFVDGTGPLYGGASLGLAEGHYPVGYGLNVTSGNGYEFSRFSASGGVAYGHGSVSVTGNGTLTAVFRAVAFLNVTIPWTCPDIEINGTAANDLGSYYFSLSPPSLPIQALPCPGQVFTNWSTQGGATVGDLLSANTSLTLTSTGNLTATYADLPAAQVGVRISPAWVGEELVNGTLFGNGTQLRLSPAMYSVGALPLTLGEASLIALRGTGGVFVTGSGPTADLVVAGNGTLWANFTVRNSVGFDITPSACTGTTFNGSEVTDQSVSFEDPGTYSLSVGGCPPFGAPVVTTRGALALSDDDRTLTVTGNGTLVITYMTAGSRAPGSTGFVSLWGPDLATGVSVVALVLLAYVVESRRPGDRART